MDFLALLLKRVTQLFLVAENAIAAIRIHGVIDCQSTNLLSSLTFTQPASFVFWKREFKELWYLYSSKNRRIFLIVGKFCEPEFHLFPRESPN